MDVRRAIQRSSCRRVVGPAIVRCGQADPGLAQGCLWKRRIDRCEHLAPWMECWVVMRCAPCRRSGRHQTVAGRSELPIPRLPRPVEYAVSNPVSDLILPSRTAIGEMFQKVTQRRPNASRTSPLYFASCRHHGTTTRRNVTCDCIVRALHPLGIFVPSRISHQRAFRIEE